MLKSLKVLHMLGLLLQYKDLESHLPPQILRQKKESEETLICSFYLCLALKFEQDSCTLYSLVKQIRPNNVEKLHLFNDCKWSCKRENTKRLLACLLVTSTVSKPASYLIYIYIVQIKTYTLTVRHCCNQRSSCAEPNIKETSGFWCASCRISWIFRFTLCHVIFWNRS